MKDYNTYYSQGLSIYQVAEKLKVTPNAVKKFLIYHNLIRPALGRDIEEKVFKFLKNNNYNVYRQKGDALFDVLVDGKRVEIKSAHKSYTNKGKSSRYYFELQHKKSLSDYKKKSDELYLVFLDEPNVPIFSLKTSKVNTVKAISISSPFTLTKYPLVLLGYLEKKLYGEGGARK